MEQNKKENLVIKKAISQRVLVSASIVSLLLIGVCLYLQVQQKHHLGRISISYVRVKSTESVVDATTTPELQITPPDNNDGEVYTFDYNQHVGEDYANDATSLPYSEEVNRLDPMVIHKSPTTPDIIDNDYGADFEVEYVSPTGEKTNLNSKESFDLTPNCFHCLCTTINGCKPIKCAHIDPCGIYGISKYYWLDAGSPMHRSENNSALNEQHQTHSDYLQCVNNELCAKETVRNYMKRYQQDCNNDGVIDCQDYIALHMLGPRGCAHMRLAPLHKFRVKSCLK